MYSEGGTVNDPPPPYNESEWGGESTEELHPHHPGTGFPQQNFTTQGDEGQTEKFHALLYAQNKELREKIEFSNQQNERAQGHLFDRVQELEDAMGPALGCASALDALVDEGEKRVKSQGDLAVNYIYEEAKRALDHFEERAILHDENFLKKAATDHAKRGALLDIRVQKALEKRAWRA